LEYYVIYDKNDNLIYYIDSFDELVSFTGILKRNLKYRLKNYRNISVKIDNQLFIVYKFC